MLSLRNDFVPEPWVTLSDHVCEIPASLVEYDRQDEDLQVSFLAILLVAHNGRLKEKREAGGGGRVEQSSSSCETCLTSLSMIGKSLPAGISRRHNSAASELIVSDA